MKKLVLSQMSITTLSWILFFGALNMTDDPVSAAALVVVVSFSIINFETTLTIVLATATVVIVFAAGSTVIPAIPLTIFIAVTFVTIATIVRNRGSEISKKVVPFVYAAQFVITLIPMLITVSLL